MALLCQLGSAPFAGKRPYLSDYKQLTDGVYCYQQAKGVLLRSLLMQGVLSLNRCSHSLVLHLLPLLCAHDEKKKIVI